MKAAMTTAPFAPASLAGVAPYRKNLPVRRIIFAALALICALGASARARPLRIVALGDSLTAGYGIPAAAAFPVRLQAALKARGFDVEIVNGGVSGNVSADLLDRLDQSLDGGADAAIVEIGANDLLRGLDPDQTEMNIDAILDELRQRKIPFLIAGVRAGPGFDRPDSARFESFFNALARKYHAPLYPFFLQGVAGHPDLQLPDRLHPNEKGVDAIVAGILPTVVAWLGRMKRS
jgi:acyl-CoA thioesterase I